MLRGPASPLPPHGRAAWAPGQEVRRGSGADGQPTPTKSEVKFGDVARRLPATSIVIATLGRDDSAFTLGAVAAVQTTIWFPFQ